MFDPILSKFGDHGAESSRRDKFQEHYAAWWCIEMLFDDTISEVICEYGEDLVINRNGIYELFQVKTKQESRDDWKVTELLPIIAKTFAMVPYFGNVSKCCFVSNEGLYRSLYKFKEVIHQPPDTWDSKSKQTFEDFCKNYSQKILKFLRQVDKDNTETVNDIRNRLFLLRLDTNFHHMERIEDTNIRRLRQFIEQDSNGTAGIVYTDEELSEMYETFMGIVGKATIGRTRQEKTILREHLTPCFQRPFQCRTLYRSPTPEEIQNAAGDTKLEKKLDLGGFTTPLIENARELMVTASFEARSWKFGDADAILEDVRFRVKHLWAESYDKACWSHDAQEKIGRYILEEMKREFPKLTEYYRNTGLPVIDELFLTGITWKITSECIASWSQHKI